MDDKFQRYIDEWKAINAVRPVQLPREPRWLWKGK